MEAIYTLAAGGDFTSNLTHEFQVVSDIGEDTIYVCEKCGYSENKEISKLKNGDICSKCGGKVKEEKAIEVGNIFPYGTKYSEAFNTQFTDENGEKKFAVSGAYGIGISRLGLAARAAMANRAQFYSVHLERGKLRVRAASWPATLADSLKIVDCATAGDAQIR